MRTLVLASTSPYRRQLLEQLQIPFTVSAPDFVEMLDAELPPEQLVQQLALGKAQSLCQQHPDALIIGSDQVFLDQGGRPLGKPGGAEAAFAQLRRMAGRTHSFYTGLAVYDSRDESAKTDFALFQVRLRQLTDEQIGNYLRTEAPFDCAGSFKIEGLGIALMESMVGDDYTSLIGLPLIKLVSMLKTFGVEIL